MRNNAATLQLEEAAVILQCGPRLGTVRVPSRESLCQFANDITCKLRTAQLETVNLLTATQADACLHAESLCATRCMQASMESMRTY